MFDNIINPNVPLAVWIASQAVGAIGLIFAMWSFQITRKPKFLFIIGCSNFFIAIAAALLLNWVLFALVLISCVRSFTFSYIEKKQESGKKIPQYLPFIFMAIFMIASIISVSLTWSWWLDWLLLAASLLIIYGNWAKGTHLIRLGCISCDSLSVANYIRFSNLIGIVQSVLLVSSMIIFYIKYFIKRSKDTNQKIKVQKIVI